MTAPLDDPPLGESLDRLLERQISAHGVRPVLSFGDGTTISYEELGELAAKARGLLRSHGVGPGGRVAIMLKNSLF